MLNIYTMTYFCQFCDTLCCKHVSGHKCLVYRPFPRFTTALTHFLQAVASCQGSRILSHAQCHGNCYLMLKASHQLAYDGIQNELSSFIFRR